MSTVDRDTARKLTEEIAAAIAPLLERYGMEQKKASTKYGPSYKLALEVHKVELDGSGVNVASVEAQEFLLAAESGLLPLPKEALGQTFVSRGVEYQLTGYMPQNPKYCYQVKRTSDGAGFKFGASLEKLITVRT